MNPRVERGPMRLLHLELENWRNFTRVDVALAPRVFLVGPNASGKSNLLDVFRFLHEIVAVGGGFLQAVTRRGGVSSIRCLAARQNPDVSIRIQIGSEGVPPVWEYGIKFSNDSQNRAALRMERVRHGGVEVLYRPNEDDRRDPERLTQTYLEQVNVNLEFREVAEFLRSVRYLHIVPQLVREPDRSLGRTNDPYGGDFLERIARTTPRTRNARLRKILEALRVAVPQLKELKHWRDSRGTPHLRGKYEHWRPHGAWQTEDRFSDGTLRLMGLLWASLETIGPLLLEEPELSLHPEVVRYLPQMFARIQRRSGVQFLISTHSRDLLQDEGIGLDEVLLLIPGREGTSLRPAGDFSEIRALLEGGLSLGEAVLPRTGPENAEQLMLSFLE